MMEMKMQPGLSSGWHKGPLPADTWNWGGVVPVGSNPRHGFYFADFRGDHALISKSVDGVSVWERIEAADIAFFNNSLPMPFG